MALIVLLLAGVCIVIETAEQSVYRMAAHRPRQRLFFLIAGTMLNLLTMAVWLLVLRRAPLGQAAPLLAGANVTVALAGYLIFREHVTPRRWAGIILITAGVALVCTSFA